MILLLDKNKEKDEIIKEIDNLNNNLEKAIEKLEKEIDNLNIKNKEKEKILNEIITTILS